jgi:hypothetical protein
MTAAIVPEYMLKLLEAELAAVSLNVVKYICDEYKLPYEEVKEKLQKQGGLCVEIEPDNKNIYKVTKTHVRRKKTTRDTQCIANMFHKDHRCVTQCSLFRLDGSDYCNKHKRMEKEGRLRFGTVDHPL